MVRLRHLLLPLVLVGAAACQTAETEPRSGALMHSNIFGNISPRAGTQNLGYGDLTAAEMEAQGGGSQSFGRLASNAPRGVASVGGGGSNGGGAYTVNFENADVKEVVRGILGDALGLNYTIAGNVAGPVTISSSGPVGRDELLATLESVLDSLGLAMTSQGGTYRIGATGLSGGVVDNAVRTRAGYGVSVVPLRYVPASTMMELLAGFVSEGESLRIGAKGNTLIVRGSGAERTEALRAIASFDDDWMKNQSVSIITLREARPEAVVPELERIFDTEAGGRLIQFRAISRLRGVLVITENPELIRRAESWIRRLDQDNPAAGDNVFVYKAKHRSAAELAKVMGELFGAGGQGSSRNAGRTQQPAPSTFDDGSGSTPMSGGDDSANMRVASAFGGADDTATDFGMGAAPGVIDLTTQGGGGNNSGVRISADLTNNSVVTYADSDSYQKILLAMRKLDSSPVQVAVNVTIAEVQLTDELRYGVQYFVNSNNLGLGDDNGSVSMRDVASSVLQSQIPGFNFVLGSNRDPDVIISALDVISDVEILSSPSLVVVENQTATLQVGDEVPITTRQAQSIENGLAPLVNQVEFRDTGIILNVTPRIGQDDSVTMQVEQEISAVVGGANTLTPTISKRRVQSEISVANGQTVLLAGLISQASGNDRRGIPGNRRLGVLGNLLSSTAKTADRTELVILIRPVVIRSAQDATSVAAELKTQMWGIGGTQGPGK